MLKPLIQHCLRSWRHHGVTQLATMTSLVMGFSFFLFTVLAVSNFHRVVALWGDQPEMSVFLEEDLQEDQLQELEQSLRSQSYVRDLRYISSEQALKEFQKEFADVAPDLLSDADLESPFPGSFVVRLADSIASPQDYDLLVERAGVFQAMSGVAEVSFGKNWVENYSSFVGALKLFSGALVLVLLVGCQFMIANSIRASVGQRRAEIEIKELLGADAWDVRTPYLVEGALSAAAAGLLSFTVVGAMFVSSKWFLQKEFPVLRLTERLEFFSPASAAAVVLLFVLLGAASSFFVVRRLGLGWVSDEV